MNHWQDKEQETVHLFALAEDEIRKAFWDEPGVKEYLDYYLRTPGYSAHNTAMMKAQCPDMTMVAGYSFWKENGLHVKRKEHGMAILVPAIENGKTAFHTKTVFDIGQTNADEEKRRELLAREKNRLPGKQTGEALFAAVYETAYKNHVQIQFLDENPEEGKGKVYARDNTVFVCKTDDAEKQAAQVIRLLAEVLLERKETWKQAQTELQADMVQYLLCRQYGADISEIRFEGLRHPDITGYRIQRKKMMLGDVLQTAGALREQINQCLTERNITEEIPPDEVPEKEAEQDAAGSDRAGSEKEKVSEGAVEQKRVKKEAFAEQKPPIKEKIGDFGKKIGGARKDLWKERGLEIADILEMNEAEAAKYITKENIWRKPDYMQMIQDGTPLHVAYFIKAVRNALPAKVTYSYEDTTPERIQTRQENYISFIRDVKDQLMTVKDDMDIRGFFRKFAEKEVYVRQEAFHRVTLTDAGYAVTNKLLRAMQMSIREIERQIDREQFGVAEEEKIPRGFTIRYMRNKSEYVVLKGYTVLADGLKSEEEARKKARELAGSRAAARKKKFIPKQLENIRRTGPYYGNDAEHPTNGTMYLKEFGFAGGEFGNWMSEKDRQVSLDMGYEALHDLAYVLKIEPSGISLGNRLSIAFGARGYGNAMAHYEPMREVINLTKMRGAGSLAHEWAHAFDDIMGKRLRGENHIISDWFMTEHTGDKRVPESMGELVRAMKFRSATEEERAALQEKKIRGREKYLQDVLARLFPEKRMTAEVSVAVKQLTEDTILLTKSPAADKKEDAPRQVSWIENRVEEFSQLRKETFGHIITKEEREGLYSAIYSLELEHTCWNTGETVMVETDFYKNSVKADTQYGKEDKGYWHSTPEMFARAFACYVQDRLPWQSDYLCGHAESAVLIDIFAKDLTRIKAYPEGEERERLNRCFDRLFEECRERGIFKEAAETIQMPIRRGKSK